MQSIYRVKSAKPSEYKKKYKLEHIQSKKISDIELHRFCLISPNDIIEYIRQSKINVLSENTNSNKIKVLPLWQVTDHIVLGDQKFNLIIKEIENKEDLDNFLYLENFHYRTHSIIESEYDEAFLKKEGEGGSKKAVLICYVQYGRRNVPAGYIQLEQPLQMVKPRHVALNRPFKSKKHDVEWNEWKLNEIKKYVNQIVRIARIVTSPEFRGIGLSSIIINHAKNFANERWHIKGRPPVFIEIMAEMLKYMDFVTRSGFYYMGETLGNSKRFKEDMKAMKSGQKENAFGMMSLQAQYKNRIEKYAAKTSKPFGDVVNFLQEILDGKINKETLSSLDWLFARSVLRAPISYFMAGLDKNSDSYLKKYADNAGLVRQTFYKSKKPSITNLKTLININAKIKIQDTLNVRRIIDSFGLNFGTLKQTIISNLQLEISQGNVIFILGPSGTGKTLLLNALDPNYSESNLEITRESETLKYSVSWMKNINSEIPIIEYFGSKYGYENSLAVLNSVGLSEAYIFIKPFHMLSKGQGYRCMMAKLILEGKDIWLIDEFCADLDPISARVVAKNFRKYIVKNSKMAIIAAANYEHYIHTLKPNKVFFLRHSGKYEKIEYKDFCNDFSK